MLSIAELLERKRVLLDRRLNADPQCLPVLEIELKKIDRALTRLETKQASSTALR
jgi:hypothetical protein